MACTHRLLSFFHFDGIREEIFHRAAEVTDNDYRPLKLDPNCPLAYLLERSESGTWDSFNFRGAIRILTQFSLIHGDVGTILSMHCLVNQWMQDRLPKTSCSDIALLAATILTQSVNYRGSSEDHAHRRALLVHLIPLYAHLKQEGLMSQLSADTLRRMAQIYYEGGRAADTEVLLRQAISLLQKHTSEATTQYVDDVLFDLASVLGELGRLREAEALQHQVLDRREKRLGINHVSTTVARHNLAVTLHDLGDLVRAKELKILVLDFQKENLGMNHSDTYLAMDNLSCTLLALGEFSEARELEVQVLDWREQHNGMDHPDTYRAMGNLASTFHALGAFSEARELEIQVLDWQKKHLGMDHPDTFWTMANLTWTLYKLDELADAKGLAIQVLNWRKGYFGLEHPHTIVVMKNLAYTLRKLGEVTGAEELFAQMEELQRKIEVHVRR
jgi:tetratricopeptide (TPR) repeat protein